MLQKCINWLSNQKVSTMAEDSEGDIDRWHLQVTMTDDRWQQWQMTVESDSDSKVLNGSKY